MRTAKLLLLTEEKQRNDKNGKQRRRLITGRQKRSKPRQFRRNPAIQHDAFSASASDLKEGPPRRRSATSRSGFLWVFPFALLRTGPCSCQGDARTRREERGGAASLQRKASLGPKGVKRGRKYRGGILQRRRRCC